MASTPDPPNPDAGSFARDPDPRDEASTIDGRTFLFRRYRVIRELGRGGMGVVSLAHDTALDIDVAVKLVPDLVVQDTEAINGLRKEVLRGMALAHPGIVRTHNFERDESGAGIVMEFVEGDTLTDLKVAQPGLCFDPEQILRWLEQLCAVLDYAHRDARIVHRDLKPRNIMLNRAGKIKVADFGIAAVISDSMSRHSMEGKVIGTLCYMSPQQAEGMKPSVLDDIHALGATIYELLTSKPPFFRGSQAAIYQQILNVVPPAMCARRDDLEVEFKAPIPPPWEETIAACLAKDPAQRPQSAGDVLMRLRGVGQVSRPPLVASRGEPSPTIAPPSEEETLAPAGWTPDLPESSAQPRSRAVFVWGALATLALAAGSTYYFVGEHAAAPTPRHATPPQVTPAPATPAPTPAPTPSTPVPTPPPPPNPTPTPKSPEVLLTAIRVPGKPGFVYSPYSPDEGLVDVSNMPAGSKVRCPYTGRIFLVPQESAATPRTQSAATPRPGTARNGTPKAGKPSADKNDPVRQAIERQYRNGQMTRDQYLNAIKNL